MYDTLHGTIFCAPQPLLSLATRVTRGLFTKLCPPLSRCEEEGGKAAKGANKEKAGGDDDDDSLVIEEGGERKGEGEEGESGEQQSMAAKQREVDKENKVGPNSNLGSGHVILNFNCEGVILFKT